MPLSLKHLKKELDLNESANIYYGLFENYIVSFSGKNKETEVFVDAKIDPAETETVDRLRKFIQNNANGYKITASSLSNTGVSMTVDLKDQDVVLELFYLLINQLKILKVKGTGYCANCGNAIDSGRKIVKIGNHAHTCDEDCAERIMSSDKAKATKTKVAKRGVPGFFGALLFALIGCVPYFVLGSNGMVCSYAAFLIPVMAGFGFFLFGGKRSFVKLFTCIFVPLILYALTAFGAMGYALYNRWWDAGFVFTVSDIIAAIIDGLKANDAFVEGFFYRHILFGGVFLLAGYVFTLPTAFARPEPYFAILKDNF